LYLVGIDFHVLFKTPMNTHDFLLLIMNVMNHTLANVERLASLNLYDSVSVKGVAICMML